MMTAIRWTLRRLPMARAPGAWPLARLWYRACGLTLEGSPRDHVWYFAFGSNMHDTVFRQRRKMRPLEWRVGRVRGHRLRFNLDGWPKGKSAPANISADDDAEVWGVLYLITRRSMVWLNATEGVPGWHYRPTWLDAEDQDGYPIRAFTYVADGLENDGRPSLRYITLLREGARAHGLPQHWIELLDQVKSAE
jgi:cation transport regulator ChaC